ncbi:MAG: hypothetical protein M0T85_09050 [Dehalococcoidales bacterium]|nr:hypothetical protein [Dehalococcoidales bacterium]
MDAPFTAAVGPIEPECRCRYCSKARPGQRKAAKVPREVRLREAFSRCIRSHLEILFETPNAYDHRLGLPRLIRR